MGKELSEMTLEELWELFPIILREHNKARFSYVKCSLIFVDKDLGFAFLKILKLMPYFLCTLF